MKIIQCIFFIYFYKILYPNGVTGGYGGIPPSVVKWCINLARECGVFLSLKHRNNFFPKKNIKTGLSRK